MEDSKFGRNILKCGKKHYLTEMVSNIDLVILKFKGIINHLILETS